MAQNQHPPPPDLAHEFRTRMLRCTLAQEARVFLGPVAHWRKVQIVVPLSPKVYVGIDVLPSILAPGGSLRKQVIDRILSRQTDNADRSSRVQAETLRGVTHPNELVDGFSLDQALEAIGWDRGYKMPELSSGASVRFRLGPGQWLAGMSAEGIGTLAVVTEWMP